MCTCETLHLVHQIPPNCRQAANGPFTAMGLNYLTDYAHMQGGEMQLGRRKLLLQGALFIIFSKLLVSPLPTNVTFQAALKGTEGHSWRFAASWKIQCTELLKSSDLLI